MFSNRALQSGLEREQKALSKTGRGGYFRVPEQKQATMHWGLWLSSSK